MKIVKANLEDIETIQKIAYQTWDVTFKDILSAEQISYMLQLNYSAKALKDQFQKQHSFILAQDSSQYCGFTSFQTNYPNKDYAKIHKIYVLPTSQGKGVGKKLIEYVSEQALTSKNFKLCLDVYRHNSAVNFYKKIGFKIIQEKNTDIGQGFIMKDYVMEKDL